MGSSNVFSPWWAKSLATASITRIPSAAGRGKEPVRCLGIELDTQPLLHLLGQGGIFT